MKPWKGKNYLKQSVKILILGQSLYGGKAEDDRIINETKWSRDGNFSRFRNSVRDLLNYQNLENADFWDSVASYEYLLNPKEGPGDSPTLEELNEAKGPFLEVLHKLSPNVIAVLGVSTFNVLECGCHDRTIEHGKAKMEIWKYNDMYLLKIPHPTGSFGFCKTDWQVLLHNFLKNFHNNV